MVTAFTTRIVTPAICVLAAACTWFGTKLVPAGEVPEGEGGVPGRQPKEVYECMQAVGAYREGLDIADKSILALSCGQGVQEVAYRTEVEEFLFSEVDLDPIYFGLHVILCGDDSKVETYYHVMEKCRLSYELAPPAAFEAAVAIYPGLDELGRRTLVQRYNDAAIKIAGESEKWAQDASFNPREKEIFYDVPHMVLTRYLERRAMYQDLYNKVSAFRASFAYQPFGASVPEDCRQTLTLVRAGYLARSEPTKEAAWGLMTTDLGYWIAENLVLCHIGLKDYAGALAEAEILRSERREVSVFEQMYSAVAAEILEDNKMEQKAVGNLGEAKGLVMPYKPTSCSLDCLTVPSKMFASGRPDWAAQIRTLYPGLEVIRGVVEQVADNGKIATIKWEGNPVSWDSWSCYDTGQIDYVSPQGEVVYRRDCFKIAEVDVVRPPSATLPASEVEGLKKGQMAVVVQDTGDPMNSVLVFACTDKGQGKKSCTRVEEILFQ